MSRVRHFGTSLVRRCYSARNTKNVAKARLYSVAAVGKTFAMLAVPISNENGSNVGSLVVVTLCQNKEVAQVRLAELQSQSVLMRAAIHAMVPAKSTYGTRASDSTGVTKASGFQSLHEFAFAIANNLKGKLGCEQVCLGLVEFQRVKLLCMSGFDQLYPRSPGARVIEQAMAECLDAQQPTCFQQDHKWMENSAATGHRLHKAWHEQTGNSSVASLPLMVDGKCVAVLSLRNPADRPFQAEQLSKVTELVNPLVPGLMLMRRANKSLLAHAADELRKFAGTFVAKGAWGRKVMAIAACSFFVWLLVGKSEFVISVPCEVLPEYVRHVAAPFEGRIQAAYVDSGDDVQADELLVQMETRDLLIEQSQLCSEVEIASLEVNQAVADGDTAAAAAGQREKGCCRKQIASGQSSDRRSGNTRSVPRSYSS